MSLLKLCLHRKCIKILPNCWISHIKIISHRITAASVVVLPEILTYFFRNYIQWRKTVVNHISRIFHSPTIYLRFHCHGYKQEVMSCEPRPVDPHSPWESWSLLPYVYSVTHTQCHWESGCCFLVHSGGWFI